MILTVTLNPCLDKSLFVEHNLPTETLRPQRVVDLAGGKGVNVARALTRLGEAARALMPLGGHVGTATADLALREGLGPIVVSIAGRTRTALTIREEGTGRYWHYLEPGPAFSAAEATAIHEAYEKALDRCELIALSGSLPAASAAPLLARMVETARARGCRVALDSHGAGLRVGLAARPWLVKPNREELSELLRRPLADGAAAWGAVRELARSGIAVVLLSTGDGPLFASWEGEEWELLAPRVQAVNALGSGDSLVAGVLAAVCRGHPPPEALRWGVASGAANAAVWDPGGISRDDVERLLSQVVIRRVSSAAPPATGAAFGPV